MCLLVEYHSYRITHDMQERITLKVDLSPEVTDDLAHLTAVIKEIQPQALIMPCDYGDIDLDRVDAIREQLPLLKHRRPELY